MDRAKRLLFRKFSPGVPRSISSQQGTISSLGSTRDYVYCIKNYLDWLTFNSQPLEQQHHRSLMMVFLEELAIDHTQSTVNQHRHALQIVHIIKLPYFQSSVTTILDSRHYIDSEVAEISRHQSPMNSLATLISYRAGLRAHELATIRQRAEIDPSHHRQWSDSRFTGLSDFRIYVVTGKGGLRREVAIPNDLAEILEECRLTEPIRVRDRWINYDCHYEIGFGQALSQSFGSASKRVLGWSHGHHGLRHAYAKRRTRDLMNAGFQFGTAQKIVSEELGHFRPEITLAYYR